LRTNDLHKSLFSSFPHQKDVPYRDIESVDFYRQNFKYTRFKDRRYFDITNNLNFFPLFSSQEMKQRKQLLHLLLKGVLRQKYQTKGANFTNIYLPNSFETIDTFNPVNTKIFWLLFDYELLENEFLLSFKNKQHLNSFYFFSKFLIIHFCITS